MIVKCERCQTRFKIPDEKVTDKGVKVRCTKCQHTFRVAREEGASAAPIPAVPPVEAPSVAKPPATPRSGTPIEAPRSSAPAASPGVPWSGNAPTGKPAGRPGGASPLDSLFGAPGSVPAAPPVPGIALPRGGPPKTPATIDLDPLMEFIGENTPTPAQALQLAAKAPIPNKPAGALALGPAQAKPAAPAKPAAGPSLALSFDENDPFAAPEESPKPVAPVPAPKPVPARSAAPVPKPAPVPVPSIQPRSSAPVSFEEDDPFSLPPENAPTAPATPTVAPARGSVPLPAPARSAAPIPVPLPSEPEPFDGLEGNNPFVSFDAAPTVPATPTVAPTRSPAPVQPRSSAPVSYEEPDPFSLPPEDPPTVPATPTVPPSRSAMPAPASEEMEGLEGNNPFVAFDPVASLPPAPATRPAAPAPASEEMEGLEGNNPFVSFDPVASLPPAPATRPVASAPAPSPTPAPTGIPDWGAPQQSAPAGIPDWGAPQQSAPAGIPDWGATQTVPATPVARAEAQTERNPFPIPDFPGPGGAPPSREILPDLPAMTPTPAPPVIAAAPAEPAKKKKEETSGGQGPRIVQRLAAVAAQLVVAAVLVVGLVAVGSAWLNDGRVELSSLSPAKVREMVSPTRPLVAKDLSNGLYETRDGHTLFIVRGEVENRGTAPVRVKTLVSVYDGEQRVKSAEGLVGAVPTPEELYSLGKADDATALRARLDGAAKEVAPGARAPFVVFFYEYPSDLGGFRLEVTLEPQGEGTPTGGAQQGNAGNGQP